MMLPRFPILLAALVLATPLGAQTPPGNVNDCTLIQDPIALRNCILRYGNVRTPPPATIESTVPPIVNQQDPGGDPSDEIVEVPTPRKTPSTKRAGKAIVPKRPVAALRPSPTPESPPLARPNPKDTLTHIEQIDLSKAK